MALHPHTKRLLESLTLAVCLFIVGCTQPQNEQPLTTASDDADRVGQLIRMGTRSLEGGDPSTATGLFSQAISLDGNNVAAARGLGDSLAAVGSDQQASEAYARALLLDPSDLDATLGYAKVMISLGRAEAAIEHIDPLVARGSADSNVLNLSGVAYDLSGDHIKAIERYRQGLQIDPNSVRLRNNLGLSLALAGRTDEAVDYLKPLIGEQPGSDRARQNLALAYGLSGDVTAAARLSRLDLSDSDVDNNLAYMELLRSLPPGVERSAPLRPKTESVAPVESQSADPTDLVFGVALDGEDLSLGLSPVGEWVVNLGRFDNLDEADRQWAEVYREHKRTVDGLSRLGGSDDGPQQLLVGPMATAEIAQNVCAELSSFTRNCEAIRL